MLYQTKKDLYLQISDIIIDDDKVYDDPDIFFVNAVKNDIVKLIYITDSINQVNDLKKFYLMLLNEKKVIFHGTEKQFNKNFKPL